MTLCKPYITFSFHFVYTLPPNPPLLLQIVITAPYCVRTRILDIYQKENRHPFDCQFSQQYTTLFKITKQHYAYVEPTQNQAKCGICVTYASQFGRTKVHERMLRTSGKVRGEHQILERIQEFSACKVRV